MNRSERLSNYRGNPGRWVEALTCWQNKIREHVSVDVPPLGPRRGIEDLSDLMARIPDLPQSYIDFFLAGGDEIRKSAMLEWLRLYPERWHDVDTKPFLPPDKVGWFKDVEPLGLADWLVEDDEELDPPLGEQYFRYDGEESYLDFRVSELAGMLLVGYEGSGGYFLLNPLHKSVDGEWEALLLHHKFPGADRVRSFAHLVAGEYVDDLAAMGESGGGSLYAFEGEWSQTCFSRIIDKDW